MGDLKSLRSRAAFHKAVNDQTPAIINESRRCGCRVVRVPLRPDGSRDYAGAAVRHSCGGPDDAA